MRTVRTFIGIIALSLLLASLVHSGGLMTGYVDSEAAIAEGVIGTVMLVGLALTWSRPPWNRRAAIGSLGFGLTGTLVGAFAIAIGIGPRTAPDIVYHAALLVALTTGLVLAVRLPREPGLLASARRRPAA